MVGHGRLSGAGRVKAVIGAERRVGNRSRTSGRFAQRAALGMSVEVEEGLDILYLDSKKWP